MQVSVFYLPTIGARSEIEKGMAGLRGDLYQEMLAELKEQAQLADELGYQGKYWQIPPDGTPWSIEATKLWGAGVDSDAIVRQIGVVPKPLQKPHPPIFQPFASSENTIRWCAREGVTAILPPMHLAL